MRGYTTSEAESGSDAVQFMAGNAVDLVVMDVVMPEQGGIEAIMEIHARFPGVPAIIMSGKVPLGADAVDGLMKRYGAKAVLSKPFTGHELLAAVESSLAGSS